MKSRYRSGLAVLVVLSLLSKSAVAAGKILAPIPHQVTQRQGFVPERAHTHEPGGPALGYGLVPVVAEYAGPPNASVEFRVVTIGRAFGKSTDWAPLSTKRSGPRINATATIPAGGWYRLELRSSLGDKKEAIGSVEPIGVGEVFVIAGQSYAAGANDALLRIDDPEGRVVGLDVATGTWKVAHDPQPGVGDGGTIWPPLGNFLLPMVRVPIGFVNVASGGTSSRQWKPGTPLYANLAKAGKLAGRFRAVLWQQGESDVIEKVTVETYIANLKEIRTSLAKEWGFEPPWLLAKSTLHPTVYNDPVHEGRIRNSLDQLSKLPGFRPGPDTDILDDENRGGPMSRRHFSPIGQQRAGLLWFATTWAEIHRQSTDPANP